ncbi:MAG: WG repeat-containing protein [Bacteroidales bacterium]|nr:WG repeat-containing protein [Bacteroidales bacterium]
MEKKRKWYDPRGWNLFWRVFGAVIMACALFVTTIVGLLYCNFLEYEHQRECKELDRNDRVVSQDLVYKWKKNGKGYILNRESGERVIENVSWVAVSPDADSLAVFANKDGKRGYFSRYTGRVIIPPRYEKALVFSEDVAAIAENGQLYFIDHSGQPINDKRFTYTPSKDDGYCFHNGHCVLRAENGMAGLVNKAGDWAVNPKYDLVIPKPLGTWVVTKKWDHGLVNDSLRLVFPCEYSRIEVDEDAGVIVTQVDHSQRIYDTSGRLLNDFVVNKVTPRLTYTVPTDSLTRVATCGSYQVDGGWEGLYKDGQPVTPPEYFYIEAIGPDLYLAAYKGQSACVLLNSRGEIIQKPS